jgi:hypothetical protein
MKRQAFSGLRFVVGLTLSLAGSNQSGSPLARQIEMIGAWQWLQLVAAVLAVRLSETISQALIALCELRRHAGLTGHDKPCGCH